MGIAGSPKHQPAVLRVRIYGATKRCAGGSGSSAAQLAPAQPVVLRPLPRNERAQRTASDPPHLFGVIHHPQVAELAVRDGQAVPGGRQRRRLHRPEAPKQQQRVRARAVGLLRRLRRCAQPRCPVALPPAAARRQIAGERPLRRHDATARPSGASSRSIKRPQLSL